jgi:hypothetical protein
LRARQSQANLYEVALNTPAPHRLLAAAQPTPLLRGTESKDAPTYRDNELVRSESAYGSPQDSRFAPTRTANKLGRGQKKLDSARVQQDKVVFHRERILAMSQSELKAKVVPELTFALQNATNTAQRQSFARALGQLGPAARDSVPVVLDCYRNAGETPERTTMLFVLDQIGPAARQSCYAYAKEHGDDPVVREVVQRIDRPEGRIGIDDACECFSVKAIQQTQGEIRQLALTYHVEVLVETTKDKAIASDKIAERQRELGVNGVYVCINKDVSDVQVFVSSALQKQGLTGARLRQAIQPHVKNKQYDRGLLEGISTVARFERAQRQKALPAQRSN